MTDAARARMLETQLIARGIRDAALLDAMGRVAREAFVPAEFAAEAYADGPLPIGAGQTISQPYIVALMIEALALRPGERVLEVGAGCGYAAAVLATMGARIFAIERHAALAEAARARLAALGLAVRLRVGDGHAGWPEAAPFDAILVSAAGSAVPEALKRQLAQGGRLVIPVGPPGGQTLLRLTRRGPERFESRDFGPVSFVPLLRGVGAAG
ncbi:protein-L-isoaspartate O-methyltransferase [Methylorubrum populi BJ001]|uniref:Protein-L-isoaspartate O-methyltransferase n=2 Tax=Methylorubrum populi TaxID=223967 RepID=PIMT_METPB|nr:RecName: Full=Protein-L-isoaspartate O-methyltransferase; AltName: Full=L-isoaspartyl protein carboxyl methyltransferase; AltName: Full=Protein L-isoaspartyl methyltransferase; AltName: Full=Protein-beta-aspartate methyltransferase; Short=PIMT [Methylorubrum populi BJ001]ACB82875.1 protein-L-isoaspartate O-methyltransferase [Methylorubrum populi BJ001]